MFFCKLKNNIIEFFKKIKKFLYKLYNSLYKSQKFN